MTLLLAAVPPFLLTYYSTVAEPHFETNTFGAILLLLALGALGAPAEPSRSRVLGCLGFIAGLACWTNAKTVVVLGPILLVLLIHDPRLPLRRGGWLLGAGFLVGSLPAWLFYLTQPDPGPDSFGSAKRLLQVDLVVSWEKSADFLTRILQYPVGSYYFGPFTPGRTAGLALCCALYAVAVVLAVVEAVRALRGEVPARRARGLWLLLLTLVVTNVALFGSRFNVLDDDSRGRYLLPVYIPLFLFLGAAITRLARRSRLSAGAVLAFVLAFHLWTNLDYLWPLRPDERARRGVEMANREALAQHLHVRAPDALLVEAGRSSFLWQFLLDKVVVSEFMTDGYYPSALGADAAEHVAMLATRGDDRMWTQLDVLGATATATRFGQEWLYEDIRMPSRAYRLVSRTGWRSLGESAMPPSVADGDLGTVWPSRRLDRSEAGELVLDLGALRTLARLVLWPTALTDVIVPLEVAGSLDAVTWQRLGVTPARIAQPVFAVGQRPLFRPRNGWLELDTAPRLARYLRVRPVESGSIGVGMVGELFAYEALAQPPAETLDVDVLVRVLQTRGVTRLLADPVVSARVSLATRGTVATMPASRALNSHGFSPPPYLFARLRLRETDAALVPSEDAGEVAARLAAAGVPVTSEPMGPYVLFQPTGPLITSGRCRPTDWRVTAEVPEADGRSARYVVEGRLPEATRVATIRLEHPRVSTRHAAILGVGLSDDGRTWRPVEGVRPAPEWAWAGRTLFTFSGGASELVAAGASGSAVRVEVRLPYRGEGAITSLCVRRSV